MKQFAEETWYSKLALTCPASRRVPIPSAVVGYLRRRHPPWPCVPPLAWCNLPEPFAARLAYPFGQALWRARSVPRPFCLQRYFGDRRDARFRRLVDCPGRSLIIGFDDIVSARIRIPPRTPLRQPVKTMAPDCGANHRRAA